MIPLTDCTAANSSFVAFGYDPTTHTLAIVPANSPNVLHYKNVPQDVYDGLAAVVAAAENPPEPSFAAPTTEKPSQFMSRYVVGVFDFDTVTGAAAADLEALADPTLET